MSGNFELNGCVLDGTGVRYGPWVQKAIRLFFVPYQWVAGRIPSNFLPLRFGDNSVTINDVGL